MSPNGRTVVTPHYLEGEAERLFAVHVAPETPVRDRRGLIYVPPFAEEMNRSRRMAALQARRLAVQGMDVLLLDLFGSGDSDGDFRAARWRRWLDDIAAAAAWMESRGISPVGLWGLRLGALLAVHAAARPPARFSRLILWQPIIEGKTMLTQFLRIRVAAAMASGSESTASLRSELEAGRPVEIAGYELAPELAHALTAARLDEVTPPSQMRVDWLEVGSTAGGAPGAAPDRVARTWRAAGVAVAIESVAGDPFWALQETTLAPDLIAATTRIVATWPA
jgi:exosortase A-associated hydrolase 2